MKIPLPKGEYIKKIEINDNGLDVQFSKRKKVALLFISLNDRYWPYLTQVINDCRKNFLPQHHVDYFAWSDCTNDNRVSGLVFDKTPETVLSQFTNIIRLYEHFYPKEVAEIVQELAANGLFFKRDGINFWVESQRTLTESDLELFYNASKNLLLRAQKDMQESLQGVTIIDTAPIEWPAPTLMRYHLFLQEEEKLKDYDYIFYMDADMRVVDKISDEILGEGITAAEHPMYSLSKEYVPPYEPNVNSTAFIKRPGKIVDENGMPRFKPYYYAGGFQGGVAKDFIEAMHTMKENIDKDFNNNYIAIWNDESHWNKYLSEHEPSIVLSPSYVYPDSLIDEYYVKIWGKKYEPKIITLTKPFTLSKQGADEVNKFIKR